MYLGTIGTYLLHFEKFYNNRYHNCAKTVRFRLQQSMHGYNYNLMAPEKGLITLMCTTVYYHNYRYFCKLVIQKTDFSNVYISEYVYLFTYFLK